MINKIKADQKNNITDGEIHTKSPNFTSFAHGALTCLTLPENKTYEYYNVETKKMDVINFPDYKNGIYSEEKHFSGTKEKDPFLVYDDEEKQGLTVHKTDNVKYYVSVDIYLNRENNFLKYLANATYVKHDADTVFPNKYPKDRLKRSYFEKYVYEVLNHNVTAGI